MPRKILLADDSVTAQNMGRKILADAGYEVITVSNGAAALKKVAERKPDLIVLDVYMPGYSGLEVCQRLKEARETQRIPILLTVGKLEPFKSDEAKRVRADAFIVKPFEASELLTALTRLEDKIVPEAEPRKPGRFAKAVAAVTEKEKEREEYGDSESGWKNRIKFPSAKQRPESEPEPELPASEAAQLREVEKNRQPHTPAAVPEGIPQDATPEEIAALAAAVAQVQEVAPAEPASTDESRPQAEEVAPEQPQAVAAAPETPEAPIPDAVAATPEPPQETIPEAAASPAPEARSLEPEAAPEAAKIEDQGGATFIGVPEESAPEAVQASDPEPSPVPVAQAEPQAAAEEVAAPALETTEVRSEPEAAAPAAEAQQTAAGVEPDSDVMEAIAALGTPSNGAGVHVSAIAAQAEAVPAAADIEAGPRWVAEEISLDGNEATMILEREMQKAQAAFAAYDQGSMATEEVSAFASPAEAALDTPAMTAPAVIEASAPSMNAAPAQETPAAEAAFAAAAGSDTAVPAERPPQGQPEMDAATAAAAWSNWRQIRESIIGSGVAEKVVDATAAELKPEAANPQPSERRSEVAADPTAIASIVDSVLAELKPKLVEEIARKLRK